MASGHGSTTPGSRWQRTANHLACDDVNNRLKRLFDFHSGIPSQGTESALFRASHCIRTTSSRRHRSRPVFKTAPGQKVWCCSIPKDECPSGSTKSVGWVQMEHGSWISHNWSTSGAASIPVLCNSKQDEPANRANGPRRMGKIPGRSPQQNRIGRL